MKAQENEIAKNWHALSGSVFLPNRSQKCEWSASGSDLASFAPLISLCDSKVSTEEFWAWLQSDGLKGRDLFPVHSTASAFVFDGHDNLVLVGHNKLNEWVIPGGHVHPSEDYFQAARRELKEELGPQYITPLRPNCLPENQECNSASLNPPGLFTIHKIPSSTKEPAHSHFDVVYGFRVLGPLNWSKRECSGVFRVSRTELTKLNRSKANLVVSGKPLTQRTAKMALLGFERYMD